LNRGLHHANIQLMSQKIENCALGMTM